ncbi:sugar transferase, partial [Roseovarius sp. HI0049]
MDLAGGAAAAVPPKAIERPKRGQVYRRAGKRAFDILLVLAFLPVYLPFIAVAAGLLFLEGGNPFYRQPRLGLNGERFSILKLRTMVRDADKKLAELLAKDPELKREWDVSQKLKKDPRITRVGALLRMTSMDELPQLWNVLKGEMSLVGPRPMMPDQLPLYGDPRHYFAVRPGITGYWQVDRRNESSFADRAFYDAAYDAELSLPKDAKVLWQ